MVEVASFFFNYFNSFIKVASLVLLILFYIYNSFT